MSEDLIEFYARQFRAAGDREARPVRRARRRVVAVAPALTAAAAVVAAVLAIAVLGGGPSEREATPVGPPPPTAQPAVPARGDVRVRVLNGTSVTGLASEVDARVREAGYANGGTPDDYIDQARSTSQVFFFSPRFRRAATDLARRLRMPKVRLGDANLRGLVGDEVDVVVVVGADQTVP